MSCPRCGAASPVRLRGGETCEACRSERAWETWLEAAPLVITREEIDRAVARHAKAEGMPRRAAWAPLPVVASVALVAVTSWVAWDMFAKRIAAPLPVLLDDARGSALRAIVAGAVTLAIGLVALKHAPRSWGGLAHLASFLGLVTSGGAVTAVGMWKLLEAHAVRSLAHLTMPPRAEPILGIAEPIMAATAVIVAPDEDGDARHAVIGSGTVIASSPGHAWIITASHVVMPGHSPASWRSPAEAYPVWVELANGARATGRVAWVARPPLDVALVDVEVASPPKPVECSADAESMTPGADVTFVPLPLRAGWKVHRGHVLRREPHDTPAGHYALLFTDLPVEHGDSGSGLFDEGGRLVGLTTWKVASAETPGGISLPSEAMRSVIDAIAEGRVERLDTELSSRRDRR